jgi:hypothetical protein
MACVSNNRFSLTITDTRAPQDYGIAGWLDWETEPTTFTYEDVRVSMENANQEVMEANLALACAEAETAQLHKNLADLRELMKTSKTKTTTKKPKGVPKYVSQQGANAKAQRRLQGAGKLEPFRLGGCRCRVWAFGLGNQCHAKGAYDGFCKTHHSKVIAEGNGLWATGFYDEVRPEVWGEKNAEGLCHPVPGDRKAGTAMPWKMDTETFAQAFADLNRLDQVGRVELDLVAPEGSSSGSDVEVESDGDTLPFPEDEAEERAEVEQAPLVPAEQEDLIGAVEQVEVEEVETAVSDEGSGDESYY